MSRVYVDAWDWYTRARWYVRHPAPFSKTEKGRRRREERRFKQQQRSQE
jgi:hypothetical protein